MPLPCDSPLLAGLGCGQAGVDCPAGRPHGAATGGALSVKPVLRLSRFVLAAAACRMPPAAPAAAPFTVVEASIPEMQAAMRDALAGFARAGHFETAHP